MGLINKFESEKKRILELQKILLKKHTFRYYREQQTLSSSGAGDMGSSFMYISSEKEAGSIFSRSRNRKDNLVKFHRYSLILGIQLDILLSPSGGAADSVVACRALAPGSNPRAA